MKKNNPHTPILLREALGTEPRVYARYGLGFWSSHCDTAELIRYAERGKEKQESLSGGTILLQHPMKNPEVLMLFCQA